MSKTSIGRKGLTSGAGSAETSGLALKPPKWSLSIISGTSMTSGGYSLGGSSFVQELREASYSESFYLEGYVNTEISSVDTHLLRILFSPFVVRLFHRPINQGIHGRRMRGRKRVNPDLYASTITCSIWISKEAYVPIIFIQSTTTFSCSSVCLTYCRLGNSSRIDFLIS